MDTGAIRLVDVKGAVQHELLQILAGRKGHFRLESGHHGNLWLDLDQLLLRAAQVRRFAMQLAEQFAPYRLDAVCGPLVGGALLAQTIAAELDIAFYYTERALSGAGQGLYAAQYRLPASLRNRISGQRVAVVDDVINAGSAVRATLSDLQLCGALPVVVGALLVLGVTAPALLAAQNLPLETLEQLDSELWTPARCPLCAAGLPLEAPEA